MRVWDLPTRLFHWILVAAFATTWFTDDARTLDLHLFAGYLCAGLLAFRLVWGFGGTRWARFRDFHASPASALAYLRDLARGSAADHLGHNPAGCWAIYGLLGLTALAVASGLLALGGEKDLGPVAGLVGFAAGEFALAAHEVLAWTMLILVIAHVLGVAASSLHERRNLPFAMIHGHKRWSSGTVPGVASRLGVAALLTGSALGFAGWWFHGYLGATPAQPYLPFSPPALANDPLWQSECESCHLAYHPALLPARSWHAMLQSQAEHFGEDLYLDADTVAALNAYAATHAAETGATFMAWKVARATPPDEAPQRITETAYWGEQHAWLDEAAGVAGFRCEECHRDAAAGTFAPGAIHLP